MSVFAHQLLNWTCIETSHPGTRIHRQMKLSDDATPVRFQAELEIGHERSPVVVRRLGSDGLSAELAAAVAARLSPGQEVALICAMPQASGPLCWRGRVGEVGGGGRDASEVPVELRPTETGGEHHDQVELLRRTFAGVVLLAGFEPSDAAFLEQRLVDDELEVLLASDEAEAGSIAGARQVAVLCTGSRLAPQAARDLLERVTPLPRRREEDDEAPDARADAPSVESFKIPHRSFNIVLAAGPQPELFQDFIDFDQLYYLAPKMPPIEDVLDILRSAIERHLSRHQPDDASVLDDDKHLDTQRVLQVVRLLGGESEVSKAADLIGRAALELVAADHAECLLYDGATETLWNRRLGSDERRESAAAGLVSFVLRTGQPVRLDAVGSDPRYDPEADNDQRSADERFVSVPVIDPRGSGAGRGRDRVLAVLTAARPADEDPFSPRDQGRLQFLADQVAPVLSRLLLQAELDALATRRDDELGAVFRQEAIEHHSRGFGGKGHVLEISPRWTGWAFRILMLALVAGLLYTALGTVHEYASGLAVIRVDDRTEVTTTLAGTVTAVEVEAGQRVEPGQVLVRFYGAQEAAELARIEREFELGLADRLRNPADLGAERALSALRAQKQLAESRLEERTLRAPTAGIVSDLRIRPGQHLSLGQSVLALTDDDPELAIVALLPGNFRPLIEPGMPLRLELQGYAYAYLHLTVERVDAEVIGPTEARRVLGPGIGDAVPVEGSVVLVHARLPQRTFESDGETYFFHDGMFGTAEVRVRSEPILVTLVPGLKAFFSERHG